MRAETSLLVVLVCAMVAASALPGCVTTQTSTPNNTSSISTAASGHAATNSSADNNTLTAPTHYVVIVGSTTVYAEAANTPAELETGLMNRTSLNKNAGMLFVFPTEQKQSFWMKDMRISLDIVFITADLHVLEIYRSVPPCASDPCVLYTPSSPIKYALEVNAGFSERNGIVSGDIVLITPSS
ncbi:MAG: DUF192 domain-containing protein [Halobacteriota archaeon]